MDFGLNSMHSIDMLREELRKLLELVRGGTFDYRRAKIPFSVLLPDFGVNQADLTDDHLSMIEDIAELLLTNRPLEIDVIVGRASQTGSERNNLSLSEARAKAVLDGLSRLNVYPPPPAFGVGAAQPIQDIPGVESELNRSVEIFLWYDLSFHFQSQGAPAVDDLLHDADLDHPAEFFRYYTQKYPPGRYDRAALIVQLVYDNIDNLYQPEHVSPVSLQNFTLWQDPNMVRARELLGYYKFSLADAEETRENIAEFNLLLRNEGLAPSDFTGEEISDAEHFVASAIITMIPGVGLLAAPWGCFVWDGGQALYGLAAKGSVQSFRYNLWQLVGPDAAGLTYGIKRTYTRVPPRGQVFRRPPRRETITLPTPQ